LSYVSCYFPLPSNNKETGRRLAFNNTVFSYYFIFYPPTTFLDCRNDRVSHGNAVWPGP
jgi:hypothetical protein